MSALHCPHCGDVVDATVRIGNGPELPFCMKRACSQARLARLDRVPRATPTTPTTPATGRAAVRTVVDGLRLAFGEDGAGAAEGR